VKIQVDIKSTRVTVSISSTMQLQVALRNLIVS
jgi:hypothetical protein